MLNLDTIHAKPFEVQIEGQIYSIKDPGMEAVTKMISLSIELNEDASKITEYMEHMREISKAIPEEIFSSLTAAQVVQLMKGMGQHFLSAKEGEKTQGPLPGGA